MRVMKQEGYHACIELIEISLNKCVRLKYNLEGIQYS